MNDITHREIYDRLVAVEGKVDLLTENGRVIGCAGIDHTTGNFVVIRAKATILCTGGAMRMYEHTTAPEELTGDGLAAAYRVGAELVLLS